MGELQVRKTQIFAIDVGYLTMPLKICPEGWVEKSMLEEGNMQYGA